MAETRAGKYGRNLAVLVKHVINSTPPKKRISFYKDFIDEMKDYSFMPRKKGQPANSGCVHELDGIENIDVSNPTDVAKLVKEGKHLMYQKQTSARAMHAFMKEIRKI